MSNSDESLVHQGSPDRFGYEWNHYSQVLPESQFQLQQWLGALELQSFSQKSVLDVGCGMGRNPYWFAQAGASRVVAADVDPRSLSRARENLRKFNQALVIEKSAYELSSAELGVFDRVTCIGVLHHLADPQLALQKMWSCVAPGSGMLVLWCYGKGGNGLFVPLIQMVRVFTSRMPVSWVSVLVKVAGRVVWPVFKYYPWKTAYYRNLRKLSYSNFESIIFDQLIPRISHYWTETEIANLVKPLGGRVEIEAVQGNSWAVRVFKNNDYRIDSVR